MAPLFEVVVAAAAVAMAVVVLLNGAEATWCVARSDASEQALQTAMDYACGAGADCSPIQSTGLCYLPNTIQAHASYAFNSFYQRKGNGPGSCDFSGTSTIAKTDPSYGSCVFPSSPSTAGGAGGTTPGNTPPPPGTTTPVYGNGGLTPGTVGPVGPDANNSKSCQEISITPILISIFCFLLLCFTKQPM